MTEEGKVSLFIIAEELSSAAHDALAFAMAMKSAISCWSDPVPASRFCRPIASLCSVEIVGTGKTIAGNRQIAEKASLKLDGCRISVHPPANNRESAPSQKPYPSLGLKLRRLEVLRTLETINSVGFREIGEQGWEPGPSRFRLDTSPKESYFDNPRQAFHGPVRGKLTLCFVYDFRTRKEAFWSVSSAYGGEGYRDPGLYIEIAQNFSKDIESREKTSDIAGGGRDIRMIASRSSRLCRTVVPRRCYCCKAVVCPWTFLATPYLVRDGFETRSGFLIRIGEFGVASKELLGFCWRVLRHVKSNVFWEAKSQTDRFPRTRRLRPLEKEEAF
ncbi:hypothetical protein CISG_03763 [Coccidioides immitis RMSCC 3703]|uniref:Uncharacterized protein n=1 Tax=Coccidioides immitis RMSCC 3703 TaxID=454286 RepID=A0A0J8QR50_COCIT|nr:hypothetical protein CISG_03763 [Coccidioides immitis RMSCC 3703]